MLLGFACTKCLFQKSIPKTAETLNDFYPRAIKFFDFSFSVRRGLRAHFAICRPTTATTHPVTTTAPARAPIQATNVYARMDGPAETAPTLAVLEDFAWTVGNVPWQTTALFASADQVPWAVDQSCQWTHSKRITAVRCTWFWSNDLFTKYALRINWFLEQEIFLRSRVWTWKQPLIQNGTKKCTTKYSEQTINN